MLLARLCADTIYKLTTDVNRQTTHNTARHQHSSRTPVGTTFCFSSLNFSMNTQTGRQRVRHATRRTQNALELKAPKKPDSQLFQHGRSFLFLENSPHHHLRDIRGGTVLEILHFGCVDPCLRRHTSDLLLTWRRRTMMKHVMKPEASSSP